MDKEFMDDRDIPERGDQDRLYAERDPKALEPHFGKHMMAMTAEGLHDKGAIAIELAWRDQEIERLREGYLGESTDNKYQCNCGLILFGHQMQLLCMSRDNEVASLTSERDMWKETAEGHALQIENQQHSVAFAESKISQLEAENTALKQKLKEVEGKRDKYRRCYLGRDIIICPKCEGHGWYIMTCSDSAEPERFDCKTCEGTGEIFKPPPTNAKVD